MNFPPIYEETLFDLWYKSKVENIKIDKRLERVRNDIAKYFIDPQVVNGYDTPINIWSLFLQFLDASLEHTKINKKLNIIDFVPDYFPKNHNEFTKYYIKTTKSIKNKLWRKNKQKRDNKERGNIKISDLTSDMKDLVRFSIKAGSLQIAEEMSKELSNISKIQKHDSVKKFYDNLLTKIEVDTELKTPSGYFAYHIYFYFKKGYVVELQVYSELSNYWRNISHVIYEKIRILPKKQLRFNDLDSRLISIGHLLYLADCELCNIEREIELRE
jgi:ppGpp synthetase/RelA/SpoT-type nucleotidyltranferase